jgi:hypothetical protein
MIGNHLLEYRLMKAHQERLLAEGESRRLARHAPRTRSEFAPMRAAAARFGASLVAMGQRLEALDSCTPARH